MRLFQQLAPLVRMIVDVTASIKYFFVVFVVAVFAIANSFLILQMNFKNDDETFIKNPVDAVIYAYLLALGEFDTNFGGDDMWLQWVFFLISSFILLIVLLNLIIAIMGSAYAKLEEIQDQALAHEQLSMILDNSFLVNRAEMF